MPDLGTFLRTALVLSAALVLLCGVASADSNDSSGIDWKEVRVHVENWIGAASVAIPTEVGAAVTALSAMPGGMKVTLLKKCRTNLVHISMKLSDPSLSDAQRNSLKVLTEKNQVIIAALNGKPEGLREFIKKHQHEGTPTPADPGPTMDDDDRQFVEYLLGLYTTKVGRLQKEAATEYGIFEGAEKEAKEADTALDDLASESLTKLELLKSVLAKHADACDQLEKVEKAILARSVVVVDEEKACGAALRSAEKRASACRTPSDANVIRAEYQRAKTHGAQAVRDVEQLIRDTDRRIRLENFVSLFDPKNVAVSIRSEVDGRRKRLDSERKSAAEAAARLWASFEKLQKIEAGRDQLLTDIRQSRDDYVREFPDTASQWKGLIRTLQADLQLQAPDVQRARLDWETSARSAGKSLEGLLKLKVTTCSADDRCGPAVDAAAAARDAALLDLAASEHLLAKANACGQQVGQSQVVPVPTLTPKPPGSNPTGPSIQLLPNTPSTPSTQFAGGLRIQGPTVLVDGQGVSYVGTDGAGTPYPSGLSWNTSNQEVLLLGADGTGVAEKPGRSTVIAHRDDMTAFLDVEVMAVVPNVVGLTFQQALARLQQAGLRGVTGGFSSPSGKKVSGQSVGSGSRVGANSVVILQTEDADGGSQPAPPEVDMSGFSSGGGESVTPPTTVIGSPSAPSSGPSCADLQAAFTTAIGLGDFHWAQSVLNQSQNCPFSGQATTVLQGAIDRSNAAVAAADAEQARRRCEILRQRFEAALTAGNWQAAQSVLVSAAGCGFQGNGGTRLQQAVLSANCAELHRQYQQHLANGVPNLARTVLQMAQNRGCNVPAGDINLLNQAIQQQQQQALQHQQQQQQQQVDSFNAFMATMTGIIRSQQNHGDPTTNLAPNLLTPGSGPRTPSGGPTGDPLNAGGWVNPTTIQPQTGASAGSSGGGGADSTGSNCRPGIKYPYQKASDCGCLQWIGRWERYQGKWSTVRGSSWGQGAIDVACGPRKGEDVTKYYDRCIGAQRCFTTGR